MDARGELQEAARAALAEVLRGMGASVRRRGREGLEIVPPGGRDALAVEAVAGSVITAAKARERTSAWVEQRAASGTVSLSVLVGDLITAGAREVLQEAGWGWLDRRGHVRLAAPGVWIERDVDPLPRSTGGRDLLLPEVRGAAGLAAAAAHLLWPEDPPGVRSLARRVGLSHQAVSVARRRLAAAGLIGGDGRPAVPDLFWAFAAAWRPKRIELARLPDAQVVPLVVTGTQAAVALGAPVLATADFPWDLLARDEAAYARARLLAGESPAGTGAATLAVAPTRLAVDGDLVGARTPVGWPSAHPLFVAAELASDPARGSEMLDSWSPEGFPRVW